MPVKPPRPRGPHLNAMRAFEAAARRGGFAAAADELAVTPGAISQQVRALEDWIGADLFERKSQGVTLTPLGATTAKAFSTAFDALGDAMQTLRANAPSAPLSIAALPAIAQLWLTPRLPAIRTALPSRAISITALETPPNLRRELYDLSLFMADATTGTPLATDALMPIATPAIAARIAKPNDLARETLLHDTAWKSDWDTWLNATGTSLPARTDTAEFSLYSMALDATRAGAGVLMGHRPLVAADIASGALVPVFPHLTPLPTGQAIVAQISSPDITAKRLLTALQAS